MGDLLSALLAKIDMKKVLDTRKKKERYEGLKDVETHKKFNFLYSPFSFFSVDTSSQLHGCPPFLLKKESISVFYVFFENRCSKMVKSSMFNVTFFV